MIQRALWHFDRTFVVTGALNILTLGVAGLLSSRAFSANGASGPSAPVWAMASPDHNCQARTDAQPRLCGGDICVGPPLGLLLAWALLAVINVEAPGWRLPMALPMEWGLVCDADCGSAASLLPALRLIRMSPATLLGVFASDR